MANERLGRANLQAKRKSQIRPVSHILKSYFFFCYSSGQNPQAKATSTRSLISLSQTKKGKISLKFCGIWKLPDNPSVKEDELGATGAGGGGL